MAGPERFQLFKFNIGKQYGIYFAIQEREQSLLFLVFNHDSQFASYLLQTAFAKERRIYYIRKKIRREKINKNKQTKWRARGGGRANNSCLSIVFTVLGSKSLGGFRILLYLTCLDGLGILMVKG